VLYVILILTHLPFAAASRIAAPIMTSQIIEELGETMEIGPSEGLGEQDLVVINAPNPMSFLYVPFQRAYAGEAMPRSIRVLAPAFAALEVVRKVDTDIVYLFEAVSAVRGADNRMSRGERVELPRMSAEIVEVDSEGVPVEVLFEFAVALDDPSLRWLQWSWKKDRYYNFEVPPVGEKVQIRGPF